ncbi:MAG: hypothetical protein PHQ80_02995 [Candidatus ainarchaeum sp.]|nr:hypothetical protein [Candidatus ainarchaeum sp.]MDD5095996.1 hypothetical protein [Candidatus ainarchaeum sp.]
MGVMDFFLGKSRDEPQSGMQASAPMATKPVPKPFSISAKFDSLRLRTGRNSKIMMDVGITNISSQKQLVSVDLTLPQRSNVGFDVNCNQNYVEKRVGEIMPGATSTFSVPIFANNLTREGSYTVEINAFSHYLDYRKVLSQMRKKIALRAVSGRP